MIMIFCQTIWSDTKWTHNYSMLGKTKQGLKWQTTKCTLMYHAVAKSLTSADGIHEKNWLIQLRTDI